MNCNNCGTINNPNSRFCIRCGNELNQPNGLNNDFLQSQTNQNNNSNINLSNNQQQYSQNMNDVFSNNIESQNIYSNNQLNQQTLQISNNNINVSSVPLNYIMYLVAILLKPFRTFKEENSKLNNPKNSIILGIIVSIIMTLISTVKSMISVVRVTTGGWLTEAKTTWEWSNLKEINYVKLIGQDLLLYIGIIFGVALIFYLANLVIKKQTSYPKFVSITSSALVPFIIGCMVLSPLLTNISVYIGMSISIISVVYLLVIFNEFINNELNLEGDKKIYFNLICYSLILLIAYFIMTKYLGPLFSSFGLGSSGSYGLDSLLEMYE